LFQEKTEEVKKAKKEENGEEEEVDVSDFDFTCMWLFLIGQLS
jgi:hypothetical protein